MTTIDEGVHYAASKLPEGYQIEFTVELGGNGFDVLLPCGNNANLDLCMVDEGIGGAYIEATDWAIEHKAAFTKEDRERAERLAGRAVAKPLPELKNPPPKLTAYPKITSMSFPLKLYNINCHAQNAHAILIKAGIVLESHRASMTHEGEVTVFRVLSRKGLNYGDNIKNPIQPLETQIHWCINRFEEVAKILIDKLVQEELEKSI